MDTPRWSSDHGGYGLRITGKFANNRRTGRVWRLKRGSRYLIWELVLFRFAHPAQYSDAGQSDNSKLCDTIVWASHGAANLMQANM